MSLTVHIMSTIRGVDIHQSHQKRSLSFPSLVRPHPSIFLFNATILIWVTLPEQSNGSDFIRQFFLKKIGPSPSILSVCKQLSTKSNNFNYP